MSLITVSVMLYTPAGSDDTAFPVDALGMRMGTGGDVGTGLCGNGLLKSWGASACVFWYTLLREPTELMVKKLLSSLTLSDVIVSSEALSVVSSRCRCCCER